MSHGLVDKLGDEDDGGDDAGDEADGAHDDVEIGEAHDDAVAEEAEEDHEDEDADTDHEMYRDHAHGSTAALAGVTGEGRQEMRGTSIICYPLYAGYLMLLTFYTSLL